MPRGGKRPGAGRPQGSLGALPRGSVAAVKTLRWRVPESAPDQIAEIADEAFEAIVSVMRQEVDPALVNASLKAATVLREEICGPQKQQVEVQHSYAQLVEESLAVPEKGGAK